MVRILTTLMICLFSFTVLNAQTLIFSENFENNSLPDSITYQGTAAHAKSSKLFSQGSLSDSIRIVNNSDSAVLTTLAFSTLGNSNVKLYFDHICKIEFYDDAFVEVSNDNGVTWTRLMGSHYEGVGQFAAQGNKFSSVTYATDWAAGTTATPTNAWWKTETFNISSIAANAANVKIRFRMKDMNQGTVLPENYAWFLDNIRVIGAFSELDPPVLSLLSPLNDTLYGTSPVHVRARITDASGVANAKVVYSVNNGPNDTLVMSLLSADTFAVNLPFPGFGRTVCFRVIATDASPAGNIGVHPTSGCDYYYHKFNTGSTATVGTGTTTSTLYTLYASYQDMRTQHLYLASELIAGGAVSGGNITSIAINVSSASTHIFNGFTVSMKHTNASTISAIDNSGFTTVHTSNFSASTTGWITIPFQTPFAWDGVSNILVNFCHDNTATGTSASLYYTSTSGRFVYAYNSSTAGVSGCSLTSGYTSTYRLNMKFNVSGPGAVNIDAGIGQLVSPSGSVIGGTPFNVIARVKNYGLDTLVSAQVNWSINGILQTPYSFNGSLIKDSLSNNINLGSLTLPLGVHVLKVWTTNPNGLADMNYGNDTIIYSFMACTSVLSGNYTIGGSSPDFVSFSDALLAIQQCGVSAPVVFNVAAGTYTEQLNIGPIPGISASNTITFKSSTSDSTSVLLQYNSTAASSNYVVRFLNTGHIIFRNMTIKALNATNARVILFSGNVSNVTLQGNILEGTQTGNTDDNQFVINNITGGTYDGIKLLGNRINYGRFGIGFANATPMTNFIIRYNYFYNQTNRPMNLNRLDAMDFGYNTLFSDATKTGNAGIFTTNLTGQWRFYNNTLINMAGVRVWEGWTYGGNAAGQEALVYNNYFYGSPATSYVFDGGGAVNHIKFYYNTFVGNSTTRTVNFNNYYGANVNITFVNNIIQSTAQLIYFTANPTGLVINHNNYYSTASSGIAYFWGTTCANLAAIKSATAQDANSVSINPVFAGITDPHFTNFALKGLGAPIAGITTDIDGQTRHATAPDMGCDELLLFIDDAGISALTQSTFCPGVNNVVVKMKNYGSNTLNSAIINWSVNGVAQSTYSFSGALASMADTIITIGSYNFLASTLYNLKFWTSSPNGNADGNILNDTLLISNLQTSLSGSYTVGGSGADFATPIAAITALNTYGVCGPTILNINPGTYQGRLNIGNISGTSAINTITIKSLNNDTTAIITDSATIAADNYVIRLNGSRYITLQSLTLAPKHTVNCNALVITNSARYNTIKGNLFLGISSGTTVEQVLLRNEDANSKVNNIIGNRFFKGSMGILMKGSSASARIDSVYIYGNVVQQFSQYGIRVEYANAPIIDSNVIHSNSASTQIHGVSLSYIWDAYKATRNSIFISNYTNLRGVDIGNATSTATTWGLIANNFITLQGSTSSTNCYGVRLYPNVYYTRVAYNSLLVNADQLNDTRGINATSQCTNIEVISNNIVSNNFPTFYEGSSVTYSDFNNCYSTTNRYAYYTTAYQNFTSQAALSAAMQKDSNTISVNPFFLSNTNLHTLAGALNGAAKPLSYVTIDIDGEPRSITAPDIGADEFTPSPYDLEANTIVNPPLSGCGYGTQETITLKIKNVGSVNANGGFSASYRINNGTVVTENITDTIVVGASKDYSFATKANLSVGTFTTDQVFSIKAWVTYSLDPININDTTTKSIISGYQPAPPTAPAPYTTNYATTPIITATSGDTLRWYATNTSTTALNTGKWFTTPQLYDTTIFYVSAKTMQGIGCESSRVPVTVNVINFPQHDAGIISYVNPTGNVPSGVNHALVVKLKNYGLANLTNVKIAYSINGNIKDTLNWTGNLMTDSVQTVFVDSFNLQGGLISFKTWTTLPNNNADLFNNNDTATINFSACMQGTFTIGKTPGNTYDFPSFTAARNAMMTAGLCGNVTFLVDTGVYEERMYWNVVPGAGPNSRITFQSMNGDSSSVTLRFTLSSSAAWAMKFIGGASYFTFRKMKLSVSGSATYGRIMEFDGGASFNRFENCILEGVTNSTQSNSFALIFSNTGQNNYNVVQNCNVIEGAYLAYIYGSSTVKPKGYSFINNRITGFTFYGIYLYYCDSSTVTGNYLSSSSTSTYSYGIYAGYCSEGMNISKNTVIGNNSSYFYGLYASYCNGTPANRILISNNMVSIPGNLTSSYGYGLYLNYSNNIDVYFNSFNILGTTSTSGRALTYYGGTSANIRNNNFIMKSLGYAAYFGNTTGIDVLDYNNYHAAGTNFVYFNSANQPNLNSLKSSSGRETNGQSILPPYTTNTNLRLLSTTLSSKGQNITRVPDDIDGELRGTLPTIGADEVALLGIDAGISTVVVPAAVTYEYDTIYPRVIVCNYGIDTLFTIPISYTVNNGTPVTFNYTGTIAQYQCDTVTLPYFISPAGNATFCAKTTLTLDTNYFNDQSCKTFFGTPSYDAYLTRIAPLQSGCNLSTDTIRIRIKNVGGLIINGNLSASYRINNSTVVNQAVTAPIAINDSILFSFSTPANFAVSTSDSIFNIKAWISLTGDNVKYNDTANTVVKSYFTPPPPVPVHATVPYASPATLSASAAPNATVLWYDSAVGGTKIHSGNTYTTGLNYANDTLWVAASGGSQGATVTVGTGTQVNTNTGWPTPYGNYYWGNKEQYLVTAAELLALGAEQGPIKSLSFNVSTVNSCPALQNLYIKITHTTSTAMTGWVSGNFTNVYAANSYQPVNGWNTHTFQTPFIWDGQQNIVIEVCFNNSSYVSSGNAGVFYSTTTFNSTARYNGDNANVCSSPASVTAIANRPNLRFDIEPTGCTSARVPLYITVSAPAAADLGVYQIDQPSTAVNLGSQETVSVKIRNYGTAPQTNFPVSFKVDNQPAVTETVTSTLNNNDSMTYIFTGKANLSITGNTYSIKAYTGLATDITNLNDTSYKVVQNLLPNYCPSNATSTGYEDLTNVSIHTLNNTSAPVGSMYTDFSATVAAPVLSPGVSYTMSISSGFPPSYSTQYTCWVKAWIDFNRDGVFDDATETLFSSTTTSSNTVSQQVTIPANALSGNTRMRVVLRESGTALTTLPCGTYTWGETEDYMVTIAPQSQCDAGTLNIQNLPEKVATGASVPVYAKFMNFGLNPILPGTLSIAYKLNNGTPVTVTYTDTLSSFEIDSIQLPNITVNAGNNTLCVYTILSCDSVSFNDEQCRTIYGEHYTTVPFFDNFEGAGMWYKPASSTNWQLGVPAANIINSAYSPTKAWVTNLTGDYSNNANDYVYSPLLSFTSLGGNDTITLSFYHWADMAASDYGRIQYSTNGGNTWATLGFMGDVMGTNWYNTQSGGIHYFSLTNTGWQYSAYKLDPMTFNGLDSVQFRFHFSSNASGVANGWAIDNFKLSLPLVPNDVGVYQISYPVADTAIGSFVNVKVRVVNFGTLTQSSIPMVLKVNGTTVATDTLSGPLGPQDTLTYTFTTPYTVPLAAYNLCASTNLSSDAYVINNESCKSMGVLPPYADLGVSQILAPADSLGHICFYGSSFPWYEYDVIVRVNNYGQNAQSNIPLTYSFSVGGTVYSDTITSSIAPGNYLDFTLTRKFRPNPGMQQICIETAKADDPISTNNKSCKTYTGILCTGIEDASDASLQLFQTIPNPAQNNVIIPFSVPSSGTINWGIMNSTGQLIHNESMEVNAGKHNIGVELTELPSGIYLYFVEFKNIRLSKKMIITR